MTGRRFASRAQQHVLQKLRLLTESRDTGMFASQIAARLRTLPSRANGVRFTCDVTQVAPAPGSDNSPRCFK